MGIGARIKACRERIGLTQEELAKKIGYKDKSTISKIESGERDIPQSKIKAFADALGTSPGYLMGWEPFDIEALQNAVNKVLEAQGNHHTAKLNQMADKAASLSDDDLDRLIAIVDAWTGGK